MEELRAQAMGHLFKCKKFHEKVCLLIVVKLIK